MKRNRRMLVVATLLLAPALFAGDEDKWDVANFTDQTHTLNLDTDEGTWLSLDVSPDGRQIVFDLLGDLYIMPITGGKAKALTEGLAWDMQPRFSPDGNRIVFTSDRGGGDNIWTMAADGSDLKQITEERFRLLNSPDYSPDGTYIVARKHFTSTRSLGSGELWLYHHTGGGGVQLNVKPNDQKDLGEPAFSHDGRYVYFSQDTTPGGTFQYNKDPNPGIYSIRRIDLESGDMETVLSGAGGAIRPTPSPDGKYLAFVRRHNYDTKLWLHEFETGKNTIVYEDLDRDMQETWAVHGVYAGISWTPDSDGLVFWAGGKIHRLDIESETASEIPFRVKQKHTLVETLRFPVDPAPDSYRTHMLRWTTASPAGDKVVYQALGHLYIRDLPDGEPKRLTNQNDHYEFYPSWSADGSKIVYVTFDDQELGSIRVVGAAGGSGEVIVDTGHFSEPIFTPDGTHILYSKDSAGYLRSPLYSDEPGIYLVSVDGGEPEKLTRSGSGFHFGPDADRVYFTRGVGSTSGATLESIGLDGKDARTHVKASMGHEFRVSPDGNWLAFVEDWKVHALPFTATAKQISIGPGSRNLPVKQLSATAAEGIHWDRDSKTVYWSLGETLYQRDLADAFGFLEGAPEELPEPVSEGIAVGFDFETDKPDGVIAIKNARIVTMNGDKVIENGTIVVENNRIEAVGKNPRIPNGAIEIDASGHTVIPGILDVHAHGPHAANQITPQQNWEAYATMAFGVTTIHDPSNDTHSIFAAAEMQRAGMIVSPRIFSTGTIVYGAKAPGYYARIDSEEDAALHLKRLAAAGAISIKSYNQPRRDQRQMVIKQARELGIMVVPEGGSLYQHNMTMIADGHTGVEHNIPVAKAYDDVAQFWSATETQYTPTLGVCYGGIGGERYWYHTTDVWAHPLLSRYVPQYVLGPASRRRVKAPIEEYNHIRAAEVCKMLSDAGVKVNIGAHGQREGLASHWEIWMFVQGGMTPLEALRSATLNGATYLGMDKSLGSIEKGKLADLVIIDGNPLADIRESDKVAYVMQNGRLYEADTLDEIGHREVKRAPFFWAEGGAASPSTDAWTQHQMGCGAGGCGHN